MSHWRDGIGDEGAEWLLTKTIDAGRAIGTVKDETLSRVCVDATVMAKNIASPTDAWLFEKARAKIVALSKDVEITLRQSYATCLAGPTVCAFATILTDAQNP